MKILSYLGIVKNDDSYIQLTKEETIFDNNLESVFEKIFTYMYGDIENTEFTKKNRFFPYTTIATTEWFEKIDKTPHTPRTILSSPKNPYIRHTRGFYCSYCGYTIGGETDYSTDYGYPHRTSTQLERVIMQMDDDKEQEIIQKEFPYIRDYNNRPIISSFNRGKDSYGNKRRRKNKSDRSNKKYYKDNMKQKNKKLITHHINQFY